MRRDIPRRTPGRLCRLPNRGVPAVSGDVATDGQRPGVPVSAFPKREQAEVLIERLSSLEVVAPDDDSLTRFRPFVQLDAADRDALVAAVSRLVTERDALTRELNALRTRADATSERLTEERGNAWDEGFDAGQAAIWEEVVCSVCGNDHDRDESAACEGGEPVTFNEWRLALAGGGYTPGIETNHVSTPGVGAADVAEVGE